MRAESAVAALAPDARERLSETLGQALREAIRVNAQVQIVEPATLPRPDGRSKLRRVVDRRKVHG